MSDSYYPNEYDDGWDDEGRGDDHGDSTDNDTSILSMIFGAGRDGRSNSFASNMQFGVPAAIISTFGPSIIKLAKKYPKLATLANLPVIIWFLSKYVMGEVHRLYKWMMSHAMASVTIKKSDDETLYDNVKSWILTKAVFRERSSLSVTSAVSSRNKGDKITGRDLVFRGDNKFQFFKHNKTWFIFTEEQGWNEMKIWCLGWSPKKIQALLKEIQDIDAKKEEVVVYTARQSYPGAGYLWERQSANHRRTLQSICLNSGVKDLLINDITDYLDEDSKLWYADRGIPHRRGYLLHGRPGCGKTSFAMAVAGEFKLNVYTISLLEKGITDSVLLRLFQTLSDGDLILLEDIDCAGLGRQYKEPPKPVQMTVNTTTLADATNKAKDSSSETSSDSSSESSDDDLPGTFKDPSTKLRYRAKKEKLRKRKAAKTAKKAAKKAAAQEAAKKAAKKPQPKPEPPSHVTLSGLLNAIDGASAPQGHVLIMTSNKPELLDTALTRPGRVDMYVEFEYASREQIRDMFLKMYTPFRSNKNTSYDGEKLWMQAEHFADLVPAGAFSPAQIQQYILLHRVRPQDALDGIEKWVDENETTGTAPTPEGVETAAPKMSGISRLFCGGPSETPTKFV